MVCGLNFLYTLQRIQVLYKFSFRVHQCYVNILSLLQRSVTPLLSRIFPTVELLLRNWFINWYFVNLVSSTENLKAEHYLFIVSDNKGE